MWFRFAAQCPFGFWFVLIPHTISYHIIYHSISYHISCVVSWRVMPCHILHYIIQFNLTCNKTYEKRVITQIILLHITWSCLNNGPHLSDWIHALKNDLIPNSELYIGYTDGLVQDCSNSSAIALELLQPCTKPSLWKWFHYWPHAPEIPSWTE